VLSSSLLLAVKEPLSLISRGLKIPGQVTLDSLFPGFPERVFAHWYSGVLSIPQGAMTQYVHMGYLSTYERDLFIAVENGVVVDTQLRINNVSLGEGDNIA
jgi:hypothetical protein